MPYISGSELRPGGVRCLRAGRAGGSRSAQLAAAVSGESVSDPRPAGSGCGAESPPSRRLSCRCSDLRLQGVAQVRSSGRPWWRYQLSRGGVVSKRLTQVRPSYRPSGSAISYLLGWFPRRD